MKKKSVILCLAAVFACAIAGFGFGIGAGNADTALGDGEGESLPLLKLCTATDGTVRIEGREAVFDFREGGMFCSPELNVPRGSQFSALLSLRNTVVLHLSNESDAETCELSFVTSEDGTYGTARSKTFALGPRGEYSTCYVNLSDVPGAEGVLWGFRLRPEGGSGTIRIDGIAFEREDPIQSFAGSIDSCTSEAGRVLVSGTLNPGFEGASVRLYRTGISNFEESLENSTEIAAGVAAGRSFSFDIPLWREGVSEWSSRFLVTADGTKVSKAFQIEDTGGSSGNSNRFQTGELTADVTDYGARGDGFTDDTSAIQRAADAVAARGGGTVLVPGDASESGRRFIVTTVTLGSNVELRIEEGAMLKQSARLADYPYAAVRGHNIDLPGVQWAHAFLCKNMPLVYANGQENVRVTGGGTIRCDDTGGECADGLNPETLTVGCAGRVHAVPIGFYDCKNVEISNLSIRRANGYHISLYRVTDAYVGNVTMDEVACESGDGISLAVGTKNVLIDRCSLLTNDDAVVLWSVSEAEPRGMTWWTNNPGGDNRICGISVERCDLSGGHGITFIAWGSDAADQKLQEISEIAVTDNVLAGNVGAVGTWPDNPYTSELGDSSPIRNVRILNNRYESPVSLAGASAVDLVSDCGLEGSRSVRNAALADLGYWETSGTCTVAGQVLGTVTGASGDSPQNGRVFVRNGSLKQGLSLRGGNYAFSAEVSGTGRLFAEDASGRTIAEVRFSQASAETPTLEFSAGTGLCFVGAAANDAVFSSPMLAGGDEELPKYFRQDFSAAATFDESQWTRKERDGRTVLSAGGRAEISLCVNVDYQDFDFQTGIRLNGAGGGFSLIVSRSATGYYRVEYDAEATRFRFFRRRGDSEELLGDASGVRLEAGKNYVLGLTRKETTISLYLNGSLVRRVEDSQRRLPAGTFSFLAWDCDPELDFLKLGESGSDFYEDSETIPPENTGCSGCGKGSTAAVIFLAALGLTVGKFIK